MQSYPANISALLVHCTSAYTSVQNRTLTRARYRRSDSALGNYLVHALVH